MTRHIQKSTDRGTADHGWLKSRFSFSFAHYHDDKRMGFGALRVLNDDIVAGGKGFGTHPHYDMEIISIPTAGKLAHKDSTGTEEIIEPGHIQVMSAGTGVAHSEYNGDADADVKFFQIWIEPDQEGVAPRHASMQYSVPKNDIALLVSKDVPDTLHIHQDAKLSLGDFDEGTTFNYNVGAGKGLFAFVVSGAASSNNQLLEQRDSLEVSDENSVDFAFNKPTRMLFIEVPMGA